ncbi:hypothetical protein HDU93_002098 [Gonapodya sp. JEL0774]|nr:hypothetical protein HDU93_002098 [Gonapodya sp. JEL0774]
MHPQTHNHQYRLDSRLLPSAVGAAVPSVARVAHEEHRHTGSNQDVLKLSHFVLQYRKTLPNSTGLDKSNARTSVSCLASSSSSALSSASPQFKDDQSHSQGRRGFNHVEPILSASVAVASKNRKARSRERSDDESGLCELNDRHGEMCQLTEMDFPMSNMPHVRPRKSVKDASTQTTSRFDPTFYTTVPASSFVGQSPSPHLLYLFQAVTSSDSASDDDADTASGVDSTSSTEGGDGHDEDNVLFQNAPAGRKHPNPDEMALGIRFDPSVNYAFLYARDPAYSFTYPSRPPSPLSNGTAFFTNLPPDGCRKPVARFAHQMAKDLGLDTSVPAVEIEAIAAIDSKRACICGFGPAADADDAATAVGDDDNETVLSGGTTLAGSPKKLVVGREDDRSVKEEMVEKGLRKRSVVRSLLGERGPALMIPSPCSAFKAFDTMT